MTIKLLCNNNYVRTGIVVGLDRDSISVSEGDGGEVCVLVLQNPFDDEVRVFLRQDFFVQGVCVCVCYVVMITHCFF